MAYYPTGIGKLSITIVTTFTADRTNGRNITIDMKQYTDKWRNLVSGTNILLGLTIMNIDAEPVTGSTCNATWGFSQSYNSTTGILTIHQSYSPYGNASSGKITANGIRVPVYLIET